MANDRNNFRAAVPTNSRGMSSSGARGGKTAGGKVALGGSRPLIIAGLVVIIAAAGAWVIWPLLSGGTVEIVANRPVDLAAKQLNQAIVTEKTKTKFGNLQIRPSEDGKSVEIGGRVSSKEHLAELEKQVAAVSGLAVPTKITAQVVP